MAAGAELEIFRHALDSIVEEMDLTLQRTAFSTNIKIRRDHTCALFDANLRHIAQIDDLPQHIGSLINVVPTVMKDRIDDLEPGDGVMTNDPYQKGLHLPDCVLISPIFQGEEVVAFAANVAHHVDIGGSTPGGIPPDSTELYQEGLVIPGVKVVRDWTFDTEMLSFIQRNVRGAERRTGDFLAQVAANQTGNNRVGELISDYGQRNFQARCDDLLSYTERRARAAIDELPDGVYEAEDFMDGDGVVDEPVLLKLTITVKGDEMTIDFTGTAEQNRGPLNATPGMVMAGTLAVVISIIGADLPKNDGFYRPLSFVMPEGTMVNPDRNRPVAAGFELAMRSGDLVTKALAEALPEETVAATKGSVVNIAYGGTDPRTGEEYVFYETIAGGYGARATKDGLDGVQTHFQNTANSPIEELESEIPVYVRRYELITDSGGPGRSRGGTGVRRDMEFYDHEASFTVLADRVYSAPWGLFGGHSGRSAQYLRLGRDGEPEQVSSKSTSILDANEVVSVQTPGGGGYGDPTERDPKRIRRDVRNEKVSVTAAREEYGLSDFEGIDLAEAEAGDGERGAGSDAEDSTADGDRTASDAQSAAGGDSK
jgi:N-methylhydantoinase B